MRSFEHNHSMYMLHTDRKRGISQLSDNSLGIPIWHILKQTALIVVSAEGSLDLPSICRANNGFSTKITKVACKSTGSTFLKVKGHGDLRVASARYTLEIYTECHHI